MCEKKEPKIMTSGWLYPKHGVSRAGAARLQYFQADAAIRADVQSPKASLEMKMSPGSRGDRCRIWGKASTAILGGTRR